jgi:ribosome-associated translation inhibitor RaiA
MEETSFKKVTKLFFQVTEVNITLDAKQENDITFKILVQICYNWKRCNANKSDNLVMRVVKG